MPASFDPFHRAPLLEQLQRMERMVLESCDRTIEGLTVATFRRPGSAVRHYLVLNNDGTATAVKAGSRIARDAEDARPKNLRELRA